MTALNTFIAAHVPQTIRGSRDFTGNRGWIYIGNQLLRLLESRGLFQFGRRKETGVEVDDDYWITIPSDLRTVDRIYYPPSIHWSEKSVRYQHEIVNGKIKLYTPFDKKASPDSFTLSDGSTTTIKINDTDCTADLWNDYLLKLTNGTYSGDFIIISDTAAADGGTAVLTFLHTQDNTIDSTTGYLTDTYLMLRYTATYTDLAAAGNEIPVDDKYESIFEPWFCYKALPITDNRRAGYKAEFEEELDRLETEQYTPTPDQVRPQGRSLPGYEECEEYEDADSEYIGDD